MKFLLTPVFILTLLLSACASVPTPEERRHHADTLAAQQRWHAVRLSTKPFKLMAYVPDKPHMDDMLTIYIEGDGFAWLTRNQPSADPTPRDPLGLRLALAHPEGNSVYLARPCQYADASASPCHEKYWTAKRFAPEIIDATNRAIDVLKPRFGARQLNIVGYSGGAAVAALVAATRSDVAMLVTVAGNLDHQVWSAHHNIQPLIGSLNPVDFIDSLQKIKQWHYVGGRDKIIPPAMLQSFAGRYPSERRPVVRVMPEFDHQCCWAENWATLWRATQ